MFQKLQSPQRPRGRQRWAALWPALALALWPAALGAQDESIFDPITIFQDISPPADAPPLPPADPFALPPAGSVPLGSGAPPLTSPAPPAAAPFDDPFGTPPPASRQVRQLGEPSADQPAPAQAQAVPPATAPPAPVTDLVNPAGPGARQALSDAERARLRALFPDMLSQPSPPPVQAAPAFTPAPAPPPAPAAQPEPAGHLEDSAISQAGALLTQEFYGQAKILPPLDLPPAPKEAPMAPKAAPQPAAKPKASPAAPGQTPPKPKASGQKAPAPAPIRGALTLVNETGDPQVGAIYQSALSRLGYTILSGPAGGYSPGPAGHTFIYYRPGALARAKAVSRDLPGRKTLAEAPGASSDLVIVLR